MSSNFLGSCLLCLLCNALVIQQRFLQILGEGGITSHGCVQSGRALLQHRNLLL